MGLTARWGWVCALLTTAALARHRETAEIVSSFHKDGYVIAEQATYQGMRGFVAENLNATNLITGKPKRAYYVEGDSYQMGFLMGKLSEPETGQVATTFVDHALLQLVAAKMDDKYYGNKVYDWLTRLLADFLTHAANKAFQDALDRGTMPQKFSDEIRGMVDGAMEANPNTDVTFERLVMVNYGFDVVLAHVYSGVISSKMQGLVEQARNLEENVGSHIQEQLDNVASFLKSGNAWLNEPAYCDAFGVWGDAVASSGDVFFARDFQLQTGHVFQDTVAPVMYNPTDGRNALISASGPGFVGSITAMSEGGLSIGVDVLRSADADPENIGLNSVLLIRHLVETCNTVVCAVEEMAKLQRGVPYLYPMCDATGDGAIVEAGQSRPVWKSLEYVKHDLLPLVPDHEFLAKHPLQKGVFQNGIFVRKKDYVDPVDYRQTFNDALFQKAGVSPQSGDLMFPTWKAELAAVKKSKNNYFCPLRTQGKDYILTSNLAVVPQMRMSQMSLIPDLMAGGGEAIQWRYDRLAQMLHENEGSIDIETVKEIITFLSPDRLPGYWEQYHVPPVHADDPMSTEVQGVINVIDNVRQIFLLKGGYWADEWIQLTFPEYI